LFNVLYRLPDLGNSGFDHIAEGAVGLITHQIGAVDLSQRDLVQYVAHEVGVHFGPLADKQEFTDDKCNRDQRQDDQRDHDRSTLKQDVDQADAILTGTYGGGVDRSRYLQEKSKHSRWFVLLFDGKRYKGKKIYINSKNYVLHTDNQYDNTIKPIQNQVERSAISLKRYCGGFSYVRCRTGVRLRHHLQSDGTLQAPAGFAIRPLQMEQ